MKAWDKAVAIWESRPRLMSVSTITGTLLLAWINLIIHPSITGMITSVFLILPSIYLQSWVSHYEGYGLGFKKAKAEIIVHPKSNTA